jgi:penicillin-binding protein 1A
MRTAHEGVRVAALPGAQAGGVFSNFAQANPQATPAVNAPGGSGRPTPTRTSVRPEAASGLDGWLMERLFGR